MFSNKKIGRISFYLFVFFLPWQVRLILFPLKPEFLGFSIYLSEIFLWIALGFWMVDNYKKIKLRAVFFGFCIFVFLSCFWALDMIAAFRIWLYVFEGILVFLYLRNVQIEHCFNNVGTEHCSVRTNASDSNVGTEHCSVRLQQTAISIFLFSLFLSTSLGIFQFSEAGSASFKWLGLAERGAQNLGDIVVEAEGGRFLRAYGSFPHPNILGGYLAVGILLIFYSFSQLYNLTRMRKIIYYFFGGIMILGLFLTFSRSAWLALTIAGIYFFVKNSNNAQVRKLFLFFVFISVIFCFIFFHLISPRIKSQGRLEAKSHTERVESWKQGIGAWKENWLYGAGAGNITMSMGILDTFKSVQDAHGQPPHNIYIIILAELGVVGFLLYLSVLKKLWRAPNIKYILLLFLIIGFFDHYIWTLYSGQMLFWLGAGLFMEKN